MRKPVPAWEPLSPAVLADQIGSYDRMRAAGALAASPRGVTLFRHADVVAAAHDVQAFSSAASARRAVPNAMDPPEHGAWRALVDTFFTPAIMAALEPRVHAIAAPADPTTSLLGATVGAQPPVEADIVSILRNWTAGDLASMAAALGVVVWFLATQADVQQQLRARPEGLAAAIDEMLRIGDPFLVNRRVTTRAVCIGEHELAAGTRVYLNWTSANRDEAVFGDPDAYRPERNAPHNLVYGIGIHACPGRPLATMELVVAVHALLQATTCIEPAPDAAPLRETYPLGGWRSVPVRLR